MKAKIFPGNINGSLRAPVSKSVFQRVMAAALLHKGITHISDLGRSDDDIAAMTIATELGVTISFKNGIYTLSSPGFPHSGLKEGLKLHCGESGLSARMFAPIVSLASSSITLTAEGSLQKRPMQLPGKILSSLDVEINMTNGAFPIELRGPLKPKDIRIDGSQSSQFLTGLLFAYSAAATEPVTITVDDLKSKPYIDLTIDLLKKFGYPVTHTDHFSFTVHPAKPNTEPVSVHVEGDWSNGAFLFVAGAVAGKVKVTGLDNDSVQADRAILNVLKSSGAAVEVNTWEITVYKKELNAFEFDATDSPDLFPPLVALAAYCKGASRITGVSRLADKESDRAKALQDVFGKMGIHIFTEGDDMIIEGGHVQSARVSSHNDHRIAMAAAVAALGARGPVEIEDADAVKKSYPAFFSDMEKAGVIINTSFV